MTPEALRLIRELVDANTLDEHVGTIHQHLAKLSKFLDYAEKQYKDIEEGRKGFGKQDFLTHRKYELDVVTDAYNDLEVLITLVLNQSLIAELVNERNLYKQLFEQEKKQSEICLKLVSYSFDSIHKGLIDDSLVMKIMGKIMEFSDTDSKI